MPVSLEDLRGVGPVTLEHLSQAGIKDVQSLIMAFPTRYRQFTAVVELPHDALGRELRFIGRIEKCIARRFHGWRGAALLGFEVLDEAKEPQGVHIEVQFFGQLWLAKNFPIGRVAVFTGRLEQRGKSRLMLCSAQVSSEQDSFRSGDGLEPLYSRVEGLSALRFRRIVLEALDQALPLEHETLPADFLATHGMITRPLAIAELHKPQGSLQDLEAARRRMALIEACTILEDVRLRKSKRLDLRASPFPVDDNLDQRIRARLPFRLSKGQEAVLAEIMQDLARDCPMARLLQGDVGCGKTLVAVYACLVVTAHGSKAVMLAPTEVLVEQHAKRISSWLQGSSLPVICFTASMKRRERAHAKALMEGESPCFVIGTHAVLSAKLRLTRLGLLVIDEQQRFGVAQRGKLFKEEHGLMPHVLVMSATPIPRTLATAIFGDLDISELRSPPLGRQPVETHILAKDQWPSVRVKLAGLVKRGGKAFVVCPRIGEEQEEQSELAGAKATFEELGALFPTSLVHGRQAPSERQRAQRDFQSGKTSCLVGTTVLELGIDMPDVSWMVVRDAERLGLSSLHQLRGRVGRGKLPGTCIYLCAADNEKISILRDSSDGFAIAEADLMDRGAGELLGKMQHGHWRFRCLDPLRDLDLLQLAREGLPS